jgi:hypothetical protein
MNRHQQVVIEYLQEEKKPSGAGQQDHSTGVQPFAVHRPHQMPQAPGRHAELLLPGGRLKIPAFMFSDSTGNEP